MTRYRIAVGGLHHETNSFAPGAASYERFEEPDAWPGLTRGDDLFSAFGALNLPFPGFVEAAGVAGHTLLPTLWAAAPPSGPVTDEAYERLTGELVDRIAAFGDIDAVYLDLHGAMIAEHHLDGEGELLRRLRDRLGSVPIVATLDFHANISAQMHEKADLFCVYRTYPHLDMRRSGIRTYEALEALLHNLERPFKARRAADYLIPVSQQCTLAEPAKSLYAALPAFEGGDVLSVSLAAGFPPADMPDTGPVALAYASSQKAADEAANRIMAKLAAAEPLFAHGVLPLDAGVAEAIDIARTATRPVILADTQDNPGAGAGSNTVGLLKALMAAGAPQTVFGVLADPEAARAAHTAGIGTEIGLELGTKDHGPDWGPVGGVWHVVALSDGRFDATGPFFSGGRFDLGPMAVLSPAGQPQILVVVSTRKLQLADQAMLTHLGIEPRRQKIIALKSSVHFRADFQDMAEKVIVVAAPGANLDNPADLPYRHLRPSVRRAPGLR